MDTHSSDIYVYSPEHVQLQAEHAQEHLGYKILSFYVDNKGLFAKGPSADCRIFYLSPSGGTIRDADLNIVVYSAKYDLYKGFGRA
ncbi:MAG: hypothetical protein SGJ05_09515 [bacterium]|nr:hypothetical protein [bacterium]